MSDQCCGTCAWWGGDNTLPDPSPMALCLAPIPAAYNNAMGRYYMGEGHGATCPCYREAVEVEWWVVVADGRMQRGFMNGSAEDVKADFVHFCHEEGLAVPRDMECRRVRVEVLADGR